MSDLESNEPSQEELLHIIWLTQQRIYEVLLAILAGQNQEAFAKIVKQHQDYDLDESLFPFRSSNE